ncbi:MAG: SDR family oxidoreductase [Gammaproteobacteria bacterium]|nr:SDR family oxidoreductase [Gammaproteobacteria bacterium]
MTVIAVTGASGFVGQRVVEDLSRRGHVAIGVVRGPSAPSTPQARVVGDIGAQTDWARALEGVEVVVHCAARAHVMHERTTDPLSLYRAVNVEGTRRLAEQAARHGVRRIVYLSSVKAAGERSAPGRPLAASDASVPEDAYGVSKREAELALLDVGSATGLETVIVRPPLVYGPGVKGNFLRLMTAIARGWPLPLGALDNRRSMVSLANLADLVGVCVAAPAAAGRTFFVSDGEDLSTAALARRIGAALGRPARLFPVPATVLSMLARMAGKSAEIERLVGTLQVDLTDARASLAWSPPQTIDQGLHETAVWLRISR